MVLRRAAQFVRPPRLASRGIAAALRRPASRAGRGSARTGSLFGSLLRIAPVHRRDHFLRASRGSLSVGAHPARGPYQHRISFSGDLCAVSGNVLRDPHRITCRVTSARTRTHAILPVRPALSSASSFAATRLFARCRVGRRAPAGADPTNTRQPRLGTAASALRRSLEALAAATASFRARCVGRRAPTGADPTHTANASWHHRIAPLTVLRPGASLASPALGSALLCAGIVASWRDLTCSGSRLG